MRVQSNHPKLDMSELESRNTVICALVEKGATYNEIGRLLKIQDATIRKYVRLQLPHLHTQLLANGVAKLERRKK